MGRRWNVSIWLGFLIVLAAFPIHALVFVPIPATRDFPWATLLIIAAGLALGARGLLRARRDPALYRGRIAGAVMLGLGIALAAFFCLATFYLTRRIPAAEGAPRIGDRAPDFTLSDKDGNTVALADLLHPPGGASGGRGGAVLIFYRGYW